MEVVRSCSGDRDRTRVTWGPEPWGGGCCVPGKGQNLVPAFWVVLGNLSSGSSAPACLYISDRVSSPCQQAPYVSFVAPAPWAQPRSPSPPASRSMHTAQRAAGSLEVPRGLARSPLYDQLCRGPWALLPLGSCLSHEGHMRALGDTGFSRQLQRCWVSGRWAPEGMEPGAGEEAF